MAPALFSDLSLKKASSAFFSSFSSLNASGTATAAAAAAVASPPSPAPSSASSMMMMGEGNGFAPLNKTPSINCKRRYSISDANIMALSLSPHSPQLFMQTKHAKIGSHTYNSMLNNSNGGSYSCSPTIFENDITMGGGLNLVLKDSSSPSMPLSFSPLSEYHFLKEIMVEDPLKKEEDYTLTVSPSTSGVINAPSLGQPPAQEAPHPFPHPLSFQFYPIPEEEEEQADPNRKVMLKSTSFSSSLCSEDLDESDGLELYSPIEPSHTNNSNNYNTNNNNNNNNNTEEVNPHGNGMKIDLDSKQEILEIHPHPNDTHDTSSFDYRDSDKNQNVHHCDDVGDMVAYDSLDDDGFGKLHYIAMDGSIEMLRRLLSPYLHHHHSSSIDTLINKTDAYGNTPLMWACRNSQVPMVMFLLNSFNTNIYMQNTSVQSAFHIAIENRQAHILHLLLDRHVENVNNGAHASLPFYNEEQKTTLLHAAASVGSFDILRELLSHGESCVARDNWGHTPLMSAVINGFPIVEEFTAHDKNSIFLVDFLNRTPLHWAAAVGNREATEKLLKLGSKLDVQDRKGNTPLMLAESNGHAIIVSLLRLAQQNTFAKMNK